jgi:DNA-binding PadR family transcriptional regulator
LSRPNGGRGTGAGPGRKYYLLTDDGHLELQGTADQWSRFTGVTGSIISGGHNVAEDEPAKDTVEVES